MKVIDLYVKIANGEIKDKTKFRIHWGDMYRDFYYDGSEENQLQCLKNCSDDYSLYDDINLNDEVEIIEDTPKCDLPQHTCGLPQYKDWYQQEQERKNKKIENLKYRSHCGGTFQEEQKYRNERDDEITDKINEIIKKIQGE